MPVICRLPGGSSSGSGSGGTSDLSLNIFTQPDEPETKDGLWIQRANSHKKIVIDNLISSSGEWSSMGTIPFRTDANTTPPVVYNGSIVMFDSSNHLWSFNGSAWTQIGDDSVYADGALCVINNTLYCISDWVQLDSSGNNWGPAILKWTGTTWTKMVNISVADSDVIYIISCAVMNNYMYMLKMVTNPSTSVQTTQLLRSNGSSFTVVATANYIIDPTSHGISINNKLYWLGNYSSSDYSVSLDRCLITSTGSNLTVPSTNDTPISNTGGPWHAAVFDNIIHVLSNLSANSNYYHYTFDGSTWTRLFDMNNCGPMCLCGFNTRLYAFSNPGSQFMYYSKTHEKYDAHTLILQIADTHDGPYTTAFVNTSALIGGTNNRLVTNFNDVFFVGESGLETTDPIYYGDGSKWIKFKN